MQIRSAARLELLILDNGLMCSLVKLVLYSHVLMNSYDPRSSRKKIPLQLFSDIRFPDPDPLLENWCPHLAKKEVA